MAYGALRFLYSNAITDASMITASSQATGRTSGSAKTGSGVATLAVTGSFAAALDLTYTLEIDSISGGTEIGEATFKWRTSDSGVGVWEETGVLTRSSPAYALSADGLGGGLSVAHTGGVGADFALADSWRWEASATYGPERLIDFNRMSTWRATGDTAENLVIDFGTATQITAIVIADHNFTSAATVTIEANATDSWGSPSYSSGAFATIADPLVLYLDQTYRYFRITIVDAANPDTYVEIGTLYAGTYLQLTKINAEWGSTQTPGAILQENTSEASVMRRYYYGTQHGLILNMGNTVSPADVTSIVGIQTALVDSDTHKVFPLFVHLFADQDETMRLMHWINLGSWTSEYFRYLLNAGITFDFSEVVKV